MRYGLLLLGEHPPDRLLRLARLAEEHGFEDLWFADEKFYRDPYVSLAFVAQHTSTIRVGPCVTDPYTRHPALTAMATATLDDIAGGRAVLGIGAGFSGLRAMGIQRSKPVKALREAIVLIRSLWAGETVAFEGETLTFRDGCLNFPARPSIPILVASAGRNILRLAGELADAVMLGDLCSASVIRPALVEVGQGADRSGRSLSDVPIISRANLSLSDDAKAARDLVKPWIATNLWQSYPKWDYFFDYSHEWEERLRPMKEFIESRGGKPRNVGDTELIAGYKDLISDEMVRNYALAGAVEDVVGQIVEIAGTGVTQIALYPLLLPGQDIEGVLKVFVEKVQPEVQEALSRQAEKTGRRTQTAGRMSMERRIG